ncbi:hypothetical protein PAL_GLEAN10011266 [Pteropus alecto]|uniref:Uncharacterized protein n=1 Tax=Pteropus alecto TaxID=9402 RepID=L5KPL6_PTEAL|nr:hypothetical protein PAL_GLEAN10011266 [Pteropus alecto]
MVTLVPSRQAVTLFLNKKVLPCLHDTGLARQCEKYDKNPRPSAERAKALRGEHIQQGPTVGGLSPSTHYVPPNPVGTTEHLNRPDSKPAHYWPALKPGKAASPLPASGPSQVDWLEGANEKGPDTRWDIQGLGERKLLCSAYH